MLLYNIFWFIGLLGLPIAAPIILASEKRRKTFFYRLGLRPLPFRTIQKRHHPTEKKPIWVHALSVGEVLSAVSLVKTLRVKFRKHDIYFSVSTRTGFEIAEKRLSKDTDVIFYFPYDFIFSVKHTIKAVDPSF